MDGMIQARTSGLRYSVESWWEVLMELREIWPVHYHEIADEDGLQPLAVDEAAYGRSANGGLHIVTMRRDRVLVGYILASILPHPHHRWALAASVTAFWVRPHERRGWRPITLFQVLERTLRQRGVDVIYVGTPFHVSPTSGASLDVGHLFEFLGYVATERIYRKILGAA